MPTPPANIPVVEIVAIVALAAMNSFIISCSYCSKRSWLCAVRLKNRPMKSISLNNRGSTAMSI